MKMKNEKRAVFRFLFFMKMEKQLKALKIQSKTPLNMEIVAKPII